MKHLSLLTKSLLGILLAGGALTTNLQAQSDLAVTVSIPFPFTVDGHSMAAGTYQFSLVSSPFLVSVLNVKTGLKEMFPVRPKQQLTPEESGRVKFHDANSHPMLSEIHFPGTDRFIELDQRYVVGRRDVKSSPTAQSISVAQR